MKLKFLLLGLALAITSVARAGYVPIPITPSSYNADVIVEKNVPALDNNTTATTDGGTNNNGNGWYEVGYNTNVPTSGLPAHGTTFTHLFLPDHSYTMAPDYTVPNALLIDSAVTNGTLTFVTPTLVSNLSFIVTSGNGGGGVACVIHHQDGSIETNLFNAGDWFNGTNQAFTAFGRVAVTSGAFDGQGSIQNPGNPRLYNREIPVTNTVSPVTKVDFKYATGGGNVHNQIYCISGTPPGGGNCVPIAITGYNYDLIVESNSPVVGRILNLAGTTNATTQSMDSDTNTGNTFYEQGYVHSFQSLSGLPHPGTTITNAAKDHAWTFASDYTTNDAIYVNTSNTPVTVNLVTPTPLFDISLLNATGNGSININVTVHHQSTADENFVFSALDWFNNSSVVIGTSGRVAVDTRVLNNLVVNPFVTNLAPFLHVTDIPLNNSTDPVTSITFSDTNAPGTGRTAIFAIAGSTGAAPPVFTVQPGGATMNPGTAFSTTGLASGGAVSVSYQWQKGLYGVFTNVTDGGTISGSTTSNLNISSTVPTDSADYQLIASDTAGSVTSSVARLIVLSPLLAVTTPFTQSNADAVTGFPNSWPVNENPSNAVDSLVGGDPGKYLNFGLNGGTPFKGPAGFIDAPTKGPSIVTAIRLYTANDTQGRDPIDFEFYGSTDGVNFSLITSNLVTLPTGRNNAASGPLNPLTQFIEQFLFSNTNIYTSYKWQVTHVVNDAGNNSMQIGEVEILGVLTNGPPSVTVPAFARAFSNSTASITAQVNGLPTPTVQWAAGLSGVYTNLTNGNGVSGATSPILNIANVTSKNALDYQATVHNTAGTVVSQPVHLSILSSEVDITTGFDSVSEFGTQFPAGSPNVPSTIPADAFEDTGLTYVNVGSGPNAGAGFAPFVGPVGVMITPSFGLSVVSGVRFYPGTGAVASDPTDFKLDGSSDGGTTFATIVPDTALSLPDTRAPGGAINPLTDPMQEVLFVNTNIYDTYRVTFNNVKDAANATSMQIGEIELLGVAPRPRLTFNLANPTQLVITSSSAATGTLQSTTNLQGSATVWTTIGPINGSAIVNISPTDKPTFFRVSIP